MSAGVLQPIENPNVDNPAEAKRVNVVFSPEQYNTLVKLARMQNITLAAALRQALNVSNLIVNADADKDTKILLKKGDSVQELKFVPSFLAILNFANRGLSWMILTRALQFELASRPKTLGALI